MKLVETDHAVIAGHKSIPVATCFYVTILAWIWPRRLALGSRWRDGDILVYKDGRT
jgi:hypothetical protein